MKDKKIQEELLRKFVILKKDGNRDPRKYDRLNEEFGTPYKDGESLRAAANRLLRISKVGSTPKEEKIVSEKVLEKTTVTINENGTQTSSRLIKMNEEQSKDAAFVLKAHGYDPSKWTVITTTNSEWQVQRAGGELESLYASKISVKPKIKEVSVEELYTGLLDKPTNHKVIEPKKVDIFKESYLLEIPLQDLHIGKYASKSEVGESYNYLTAIQRAKQSVRDILKRAKGKNIEKILFLLGGDMFHSDTTNRTTTAGTQLESDILWQDMFVKGVQLLSDLIDEMLTIAPVDVITISGNHDVQTMMHAQVAMKAYYRNDPNVRVDTRLTYRKYYEYGKCLLGFTHGDQETNRISGVMQVEMPKAWGRTLFREIHAGHLHSEQTKESNGIIIRNISSVAGTDGWHSKKGYVGAQKKLQAFLWSKSKGLMEIWNSPVIQSEKVLKPDNASTFEDFTF